MITNININNKIFFLHFITNLKHKKNTAKNISQFIYVLSYAHNLKFTNQFSIFEKKLNKFVTQKILTCLFKECVSFS